MNWLTVAALIAYFAIASVIAYALGRYRWPTLRSEDTATDRITRTHPLAIALALTAVALAWPLSVSLGMALGNSPRSKDRP